MSEAEKIGDCGSCSMFEQDPVTASQGQCRFEPPKVFMVPMKTLQGTGLMPASVFPSVESSCWCGCWSEKPQAETIQ